MGAEVSTREVDSIPTTSSSIIHKVPEEFLSACQRRDFGNKVILCFEEEFSEKEAKKWVAYYNQRNDIKLTVVGELPNALFVVLFAEDNLAAAKATLLASSPIGVCEIFASVNDYSDGIDPCNQPGFKHLVTIHIYEGSKEIYGCIKYVAALVGKYVKARLDQGSVHRHIVVVVESLLKIFPAQGFFQLSGPDITKVCFDYVGRKLWCCYCLSYRHLPKKCSRPRPDSETFGPLSSVIQDLQQRLPPGTQAKTKHTPQQKSIAHQSVRGNNSASTSKNSKHKRGYQHDRPQARSTTVPTSGGGSTPLQVTVAGARLIPPTTITRYSKGKGIKVGSRPTPIVQMWVVKTSAASGSGVASVDPLGTPVGDTLGEPTSPILPALPTDNVTIRKRP